jgi:hypothetical protein
MNWVFNRFTAFWRPGLRAVRQVEKSPKRQRQGKKGTNPGGASIRRLSRQCHF